MTIQDMALARTGPSSASMSRLLPVEEILLGVAVEGGAEAALVKVVTDEANGASDNEQAIEELEVNVLLCLLGCERA